MTLEERVRRIEEWIIAPNLKAGLRIRDAIRASLDAPCDEPAGARHYCAKHAVGSAYGCGACKGERIAALEAERDSLRAQLADAHRVLAQGETIDAATERDTREKMERLERGVRGAARLAERVLADRVAAFDSQLRLYPGMYCCDDAQEHEEAKAKLAALRAALEG